VVPHAYADSQKLTQIFINLISNAVKFTREGGTVRIDLEERPSGELLISVTDTGIGMSPEEIDVALQPFGQVENVLTKEYEGGRARFAASETVRRIT
jgi:two-component system cell cycle sensor histidine kinase PleC